MKFWHSKRFAILAAWSDECFEACDRDKFHMGKGNDPVE